MAMPRRTRFLALVTVMLLVASCGGGDDDQEASGTDRKPAADASARPATAAPAAPTEAPSADVPAADATAAAPAPGAQAPVPVAAGAKAPASGRKTQAPASGGGASPAPASAPAAPASGGGAPAPAPAPGGGTPAPAPAQGGAQAPAVPTGSVVVIGHVGDYSGVVGSVLGQGNVMAQVVARHINDTGGLNGHPVRLITADAAGDPARALSLVRDMVENKGAIAFMGNLWPLSAPGPRNYLEQKSIPVIGGDVSQGLWFQSPMYFPQGSSFPTVSLAAVKTAVNAGKKKIAVVYCVEVEACKIWHDTATSKGSSVGGEIVYTAQVSLAQPDFTAECLQAQRNGAEAIMAGVESASISRLARSCAQQGYKPQFVTASYATIASTAKDPRLDGLLAPVQTFPFPADDIPGAKEYRAAVERYAPTLEQAPSTSSVWASGALLRDVSRQLPASPTSADFLAGLYQVKDNTLGGLTPPITFNQGKAANDITCYFLIALEGGRYTAPKGSKQDCL